MACILLWTSAVRVHESQAYRKMDVTRERISRILELRETLLSFQTGFNLANEPQLQLCTKQLSTQTSHQTKQHYLKDQPQFFVGDVDGGQAEPA